MILPSAFQSASRRLEICTERNERRVYLLLCKDEVEIVWMYAIRVPSTARGGPSVAMRKTSQRVKMACEVRTRGTQLAETACVSC